MDQLSCLKTFIDVAQTKSFRAAARRRGLSRASMTKHIAALEKMLGARLLTRNSQFVSLTDAGTILLDRGERIIEELEGLSEEIRGQTAGLLGVVRVGVPPAFGAHHLIQAIAEFIAKVKGIDIALFFDDGTSNLVKEGLDISIRITEALPDTAEVAKLLANAPQLAVASPDYLSRSKPLLTPSDLQNHQCLIHTLKTPTDVWHFNGPAGHVSIPVTGRIRSNFGSMLLSAAVAGQGIAIHTAYMARPYIEAGQLKVVLPEYEPTRLHIYAVYPQRHFLPARVRVFLDFLKQWLVEHKDRLQ